MKIIFQVIIPPIFAIVGLVLMNQTSSAADAAVVKNLPLPPSLYVAQDGPVGTKNTEILFQSNTPIDEILSAANASMLKYKVVDAIKNAKPSHDIGYDVINFTAVGSQVR